MFDTLKYEWKQFFVWIKTVMEPEPQLFALVELEPEFIMVQEWVLVPEPNLDPKP